MSVKNAVIVGGTAAVSNKVVSQLSDMGIALKERLGGADCFDTQMKIYEYGLRNKLWSARSAIVATGGHYGDALSVSPVSFARKIPVFLVDSGNLRTPQKKALTGGAFSDFVIVGGPAAVSSNAEKSLRACGTVTRLGGATQYETSADIASWAVDEKGFVWDGAAFTTGKAPYDALAGSVLQGKGESVLLLVNDRSDATVRRAVANKASIQRISFFGGDAAVSADLRSAIVRALAGSGIEPKPDDPSDPVVDPSDPVVAPTKFGFAISTWNDRDVYKVGNQASDSVSNDDGSIVYDIDLDTNGTADCADDISFEAIDVTPKAYRDMYASMGVPRRIAAVSKTTIDYAHAYYVPTILEPFPDGASASKTTDARSSVKVTVKTDMGVRAVKINASYKGKLVDTVYLLSTGKTDQGESAKADRDLYKRVRQKVEAKLWKPGMGNYEKLAAVEDYINATTHYPGTEATSKDANPLWWNDWAFDGKDLLYGRSLDTTLNWLMKFQGGITTCQAAGSLVDVATEDIGLRYLYDGKTDTVAKGEGVWRAMGEYSSNPSNPFHESLVYQNRSGERIWLDAQGLDSSCDLHRCEERIVSLS